MKNGIDIQATNVKHFPNLRRVYILANADTARMIQILANTDRERISAKYFNLRFRNFCN